MTVTTYKWTVERYHQAIEAGLFDDQPVELLQGDIVLMPPEREPHAYYNTEAGDYLRGLLGSRVKIRDAKPITLPNDSEPAPDIAIVKPLGRIYLDHHPYPEDIFWLIEFSQTTLDKDLGQKKAVYAEAGIPEYWAANVRQRQLIVFRELVQSRYTTELTLTTGTISPLAFVDVQMEVSRLINL
ncbi:Uma2 family endonuclease [Acaryochloris sp. IP29b_bin.148]|uniref:Uma2 family endonuclease n=1 Tax=Acaryochloris sp. IP29b_bin.148 TaxID=2969218 RepID=UPI002607A5C7|nr:Uma2 family endonuclease [Acaryochloris sp. IP29b_bin.148]